MIGYGVYKGLGGVRYGFRFLVSFIGWCWCYFLREGEGLWVELRYVELGVMRRLRGGIEERGGWMEVELWSFG